MDQSPETITVDDVIHEQRPKRFWLDFSPSIEVLYREENKEENCKFVIKSWIVALFLYNSFLVSDYFVTNESLDLYIFARICVGTPVIMILLYFISKKNSYYQILNCAIPSVMALTLSVLLILTRGPYRSNYLFGDILVMMCGCVISRPRLPNIIVTVILQCILYQLVVLKAEIFDVEGGIVSGLFCVSGGVVTIMTAYSIEQISRRAFLLNLRVRLLNRTLEAMAMVDPLTGLGNRRAYEDSTRHFWGEQPVEGAFASFILIDLDHFKSFNDNYGHPAGDLCLTTIGRCVQREMRNKHDRVVRFGGEEFIVFLPDTDFTDARQIAERIRLAIVGAGIPHPVIAPDAVVTASLGVATSLTSECAPSELVVRADLALYAAKHNGRNQVWPPLGSDHGRLEYKAVGALQYGAVAAG